MEEARAYAPGYIPGFFGIYDEDDNYQNRGSVGAGFCLARGVVTTVTALGKTNDEMIWINGSLQEPGTVTHKVLARFFSRIGRAPTQSYKFIHQTDLPLGNWFGACSAIALSGALALNEILGNPLTFNDVTQVAYAAAAQSCRPFLGSVTSQVNGGFCLSHAPGGPGLGRVSNFPFEKNMIAVIYEFKPVEGVWKSPMLSDLRSLNELGSRCKDDFSARTTTVAFLKQNHRFMTEGKLISPRVASLLEVFEKKGVPGNAIPGTEAVLFLVMKEIEADLRKALTPLLAAGTVFASEIDTRGARVLQPGEKV